MKKHFLSKKLTTFLVCTSFIGGKAAFADEATTAHTLLLAATYDSKTNDTNTTNGKTNNAGTNNNSGSQPTTATKNAADNTTNNEAEIFAILNTLDAQEITASAEVKNKKVADDVSDFAKDIYEDHSKHLKKTAALAQKVNLTPTETEAVTSLKTKGDEDLSHLRSLEGSAFEHGYVDLMVKGHTDALNLIDDKLMAMATNEDVKKYLTKTRKTIAHHLDEAKELQSKLK